MRICIYIYTLLHSAIPLFNLTSSTRSRGWRVLDRIGRNGHQMLQQTIKSDHIHPFWVPLDAFDHSETLNWAETSKTHEFNLERKSQLRSLKTVTIPNHQNRILNEKARGLISGTEYECVAFIETSRPRWVDASTNLLVNLSWDCINRVCWFWHPCSRDITPMDLQMHWIARILLFLNPKGPYEPNLKGFSITHSGFRMWLRTTTCRVFDRIDVDFSMLAAEISPKWTSGWIGLCS